MEKSLNPVLSEIQDLILKRYDFESCITPSIDIDGDDGDYINVFVFGDESYIFTIGILEDKITINPVIWPQPTCPHISLYNEEFLEELWESIDVIISFIS